MRPTAAPTVLLAMGSASWVGPVEPRSAEWTEAIDVRISLWQTGHFKSVMGGGCELSSSAPIPLIRILEHNGTFFIPDAVSIDERDEAVFCGLV